MSEDHPKQTHTQTACLSRVVSVDAMAIMRLGIHVGDHYGVCLVQMNVREVLVFSSRRLRCERRDAMWCDVRGGVSGERGLKKMGVWGMWCKW